MSNSDMWWQNSLEYSSRTDIGMRRTNNQDSRCCHPAPTPRLWHTRGHLFAVADGMGAHAAGELASQIATDSIPQAYFKKTGELPWDAVRDAVLQTHAQIKRQGSEEEAFRDMGTTVDVLLILPEGAFVAHVGDSRVYRLRNGVYEQLTFDHSLLWEIKRSGRVPEDKVPAFIPKNVITRSLGPTENLKVDVEGPFPLAVGDTFLLCSDGLSGQIDDCEMAQILQLMSPDEATETLVNLANLRGGPDNVTVTVVKIIGIPPKEEEKKDPILEKRPRLSTMATTLLVLSIISSIIGVIMLSPSEIQNAKLISAVAFGLGLVFGGIFAAVAKDWLFPADLTIRPKIEPLGHAPYETVSAIPTPTFAARFTDIEGQLEEAVTTQYPIEDGGALPAWKEVLNKAREKGNFGDVIRCDARIVNFLMNEVKRISVANQAAASGVRPQEAEPDTKSDTKSDVKSDVKSDTKTEPPTDSAASVPTENEENKEKT